MGASPTPQATPSLTPDLRGMIGQMLLVGFRGLTVAEAPTIAADIRDRGLGRVLLFDRDLPCGTAIRNVDLVEGMIRTGDISEARIAESVARMAAFKAPWGL